MTFAAFSVISWRILPNITILLHALVKILLRWQFQDRASSNTTPKYLKFKTRFTRWSPMLTVQSPTRESLAEVPKRTNSVFFLLRKGYLSNSYVWRRWRSQFRISSISLTLLEAKYSTVSSAYIKTLQCETTLGKSLTKITKSRGPRIEPCGNPDDITL